MGSSLECIFKWFSLLHFRTLLLLPYGLLKSNAMRLIASFLSWLSEESSSRPSFLIQLLILLCPKFLKLSISKLELFKGSSSTDPYYNIIEEILIFFERVLANFIFLILTPKPSNSTSKFLNSGFFCSLRCSFQVYGNLVYESESSYVSCLLHNSMTFFFFSKPRCLNIDLSQF